MPATLDGKLVVAVSSRALFDFESENSVFDNGSPADYHALQKDLRDIPARPGPAFNFIRKLLQLNTPERAPVEVVLLSRTAPQSGRRVFNSIAAHGLPIIRAFFTSGSPVRIWHKPLHTDLFLSAEDEDVRHALALGVPAARVMLASGGTKTANKDELRVAFDGDAVLLDGSAEAVYQREGLVGFTSHEVEHQAIPLGPGPLARLLRKINHLQSENAPIRTALMTARSAPTHERALHSLEAHKIKVDEAYFLGGLVKAPFLDAWGADFFFDDQMTHCEPASAMVPTGHVGAAPAVAKPS
jgi:5'-nucleotidase